MGFKGYGFLKGVEVLTCATCLCFVGCVFKSHCLAACVWLFVFTLRILIQFKLIRTSVIFQCLLSYCDFQSFTGRVQKTVYFNR